MLEAVKVAVARRILGDVRFFGHSAVRMVRKLSLLKKQAGIFCPLSPKTLLNLHNFREITKFLN